VKSPRFACLIGAELAKIVHATTISIAKGLPMKRSRRVVLTLMGSAAVGAVSMGFVPRRGCGPGEEAIPGVGGEPYCRPVYGGFGGTLHHFHGDGHGHGRGHAGG
jgi:hypothetical protein